MRIQSGIFKNLFIKNPLSVYYCNKANEDHLKQKYISPQTIKTNKEYQYNDSHGNYYIWDLTSFSWKEIKQDSLKSNKTLSQAKQ